MEIILLKDMDKVGAKHDVVAVKDGYGRNFLIPNKIAIIANKSNMARLSELKRQEDARENKMVDTYKEIADRLSSTVLRIGAKSGTSGKIFGSVTNVQIGQAMKEQLDIDVERRKIALRDEVKELGTYVADLHLHKDVKAVINFEVVGE